MNVFLRIGLVVVFLILIKEGVRLTLGLHFLIDSESPFPLLSGLLLGVCTTISSFFCINLVFNKGQVRTNVVVLLSNFLLVLLAYKILNSCESIYFAMYPVEYVTCERLPRIFYGLIAYSIIMLCLEYFRLHRFQI